MKRIDAVFAPTLPVDPKLVDPKLAVDLLTLLASALVSEADIEVVFDQTGKVGIGLRRPEKPCMHCKQPTRDRCYTGSCEGGPASLNHAGVGTPRCSGKDCAQPHHDVHWARCDR